MFTFLAAAGVTLSLSIAAPPDLIYTNATIHTMDPAQPRAAALAVSGERIAAVGSVGEVRAIAGPSTREIDLSGKTILPGLNDCHGHVARLGFFGLGLLDLTAAASYDDAIARVAERAAQAGPDAWVLGGRWDHESWSSRELPTHNNLSHAVPDHPVWLRRVDGHAGLANAEAMRRAGVTKETSDPPGGEILRDAAGEPTGVFIDTAMSLIARVIPPDALGSPTDGFVKAQEMCLEAGLTCVHDAGVSPPDIEAYRELERTGQLKLRVYAMVAGAQAVKHFDIHDPYLGGRLTVRAAKLVADGAMGSRGAWMLEPYADRRTGPDGAPYVGLAVTEPEFIEAVARHALERGYQVCTHAIGDRANRETLDAYERALGGGGGGGASAPDHRFRIEHAQLLSPRDVPRFAALGVIASMQPTHCTSDMRWVEARVGPERAKGAYAWASLLTTGAVIAGGSDFPVESHKPFLGFHAAVTRQNAEGRPSGGWLPEERMTREQTLRSMTADAAFAAFDEAERGMLRAGMLADFIVIDRDVMECDTAGILQTSVLLTVIGGEQVFVAGAEP